MIKLFLNRFRRDHGAIVGRLSQEVVNRQGIVAGHQYICDTMEREGGCLEPVNITSWWLNANASPARCFSSNR